MKCKHCGEENANDSNFCEFCGAKMTTDNPGSKHLGLIILGLVVMLVCIATILFVFFKFHNLQQSDSLDNTGVPQQDTVVTEAVVSTDTVVSEQVKPVAAVSGKPYISVEKMNVLYAGITNPVTVNVDDASVSFIGCNVKSMGNGRYDIMVPTSLIGKKVEATATCPDGAKSKQEFRVKKVPDPMPYLGANIWGGKRSKSELLEKPFISARMGDDFAYDLKWTINSFRLTVVSRDIEGAPNVCSSGQFDASVINAINNAGAGTVLVFSDIKASSVVGERTLRDITIRIK